MKPIALGRLAILRATQLGTLLAVTMAGAIPLATGTALATPIVTASPETVDLARVIVSDGEISMSLDEILPPGPVILHFWATWCAPCRHELPALDRLALDRSADRLSKRLLLISVDRFSHDRVAAFLGDDLGLGLQTWQDADGTAGPTFRLFGFPNTILLDADHQVVWRHSGPVDWDDPSIRQGLLTFVTDETSTPGQ